MIVKITPYALLIAGLCLSNSNICMNNKRTGEKKSSVQQISEANSKQETMGLQELKDFLSEKEISEKEIDDSFREDIKKICNKIAQNDQFNRSAIMIDIAEDCYLAKLFIALDVVDLNLQDNGGWTALMYSIGHNRPEIAKILIEKGANLNLKDKSGWTALMCAMVNKQSEIAKLLIEKGAHLNLQDNGGSTGLMFSIGHKQPEIAKLLIEKGAHLNLQNKHGWTPLMYILQKLPKMSMNDFTLYDLVNYALATKLLFNNATVSEEARNVMLDKNGFGYSFFAAIVSLQKSINDGNKNSLHKAITACSNNPTLELNCNGKLQTVAITPSDLIRLALCKHQPCNKHDTTCPSHCQNSRERGGKQIRYCIENNSLKIQDLLEPIKTCNSLSLITLKQIVSCINHQGREKLQSAVEKRRNNQISIEVIERHEMVTTTDGFDLGLTYL